MNFFLGVSYYLFSITMTYSTAGIKTGSIMSAVITAEITMVTSRRSPAITPNATLFLLQK